MGFVGDFYKDVGASFGIGGPSPNDSAYSNPYLEKFMSTNNSRSNKYDTRGDTDRSGFLRSMQNMNLTGSRLNKQAAGYNPLIKLLSAGSRGEGPSVVQDQLKNTLNRNVAQQLGLAAGNKGINPALAARLAAQNTARLGQENSYDAAQARLQEMIEARNQEIAARQAQSGATGMAGNLYGNQGGMFSNMYGQNLGAGMDYEKMSEMLAEQERQAKMSLSRDQYQADQDRIGKLSETISKGAQVAAMMSDERSKTDIKDADGDLSEFLDAIKAHSYKYKPEFGQDDKKHISPMAQEFEKTKVGKGFIFEKGGVKHVDYGKMAGVMMASAALLNKRLNKIENETRH